MIDGKDKVYKTVLFSKCGFYSYQISVFDDCTEIAYSDDNCSDCKMMCSFSPGDDIPIFEEAIRLRLLKEKEESE